MAERKPLGKHENAILLSEVDSLCPICAKPLIYEKKVGNIRDGKVLIYIPLTLQKRKRNC